METLPCPFCDAGDTTVVEITKWPCDKLVVDYVEVRHRCERIEGQPQSYLTIKGKTMEDAIAAWNRLANFPTNGT